MICFDLEGPLSPQDNAYEVMGLARKGGEVFEVLSEYDDVLALKERPGYEPGDTLKLIVPFLVHYGITDEDIMKVSEGATLVDGMSETVRWFKERDIPVRVISTSYQQHAHTIGGRLGIPSEEIASTKLALQELKFDQEIMDSLKRLEEKVLSQGLTGETTKLLDEFYFSSGLFNRIGVEVVGGQKKVDAMLSFAKEMGKDLRDISVVGDSITDYKMLQKIKKEGGLAIAFNANRYCLPYASVGIATTDGRALIPIIDAFGKGGMSEALEKVDELEKNDRTFKTPVSSDNYVTGYYNNLERESVDMEGVLKVHKEMRMRVRGEAGKLG